MMAEILESIGGLFENNGIIYNFSSEQLENYSYAFYAASIILLIFFTLLLGRKKYKESLFMSFSVPSFVFFVLIQSSIPKVFSVNNFLELMGFFLGLSIISSIFLYSCGAFFVNKRFEIKNWQLYVLGFGHIVHLFLSIIYADPAYL